MSNYLTAVLIEESENAPTTPVGTVLSIVGYVAYAPNEIIAKRVGSVLYAVVVIDGQFVTIRTRQLRVRFGSDVRAIPG